jgi:DinB superfamily
MSNDEVMIAGTLAGWKGAVERADKFFAGLNSEDLVKQVVPGRNRLIYLLGHLTATHERMIVLLGLGERAHPEFDAIFLSSPDKASELPSIEVLRSAWLEVNKKLNEGIARLSASDWVAKHSAVSEEDFAKDPLRNRLSILLSRTNHLSYHLGQTALFSK